MKISPLFAAPLMQVQLDLDLDKLTELALQLQNKDKKGAQAGTRGWQSGSMKYAFTTEDWQENGNLEEQVGVPGWHDDEIRNQYLQVFHHEEFIKLKKEITQHLQVYQLEVFHGMTFKDEGKLTHSIRSMWVNINETHTYNEWHIHPYSTLSGVFYIKHDGSVENGDILFKHPVGSYMTYAHWPAGIIERNNEITSEFVPVTPQSNMLIIFPSWLEHRVEINLKNDSRISVSCDAGPLLEKKS